MSDEKKLTSTVTNDATTYEKSAAAKPQGKLARAAESGDPTVQHALAELQTAQMNRSTLDVEEADVKAADAQVKAAQDRLADLGYE